MACTEFQQLEFRANHRDRSLAAFESFRRAVVCLRRSEVASERSAVDSIEPKVQIHAFLLDFSGRYTPYRSRMAELLRLLQGSASWCTAMEADSEANASIHRVIHETKAVCSGRGVNKLICKDLEKAAAVAKAKGDLGVLSVDAVPTPQKKTKPMLPVASKTGNGVTAKDSCEGIRDGVTTKRAADPWASRVSPKAPKTPKRDPLTRGGGPSSQYYSR